MRTMETIVTVTAESQMKARKMAQMMLTIKAMKITKIVKPFSCYLQLFLNWLSTPLMMRDRVRVLNLLHVADAPDKAHSAIIHKTHPTEKSQLTGAFAASPVTKDVFGQATGQRPLGTDVEKQLDHLEAVLCHKLRSKCLWEISSQWQLVAAMMDRMCMCVYLLVSVGLIVMFYPVIGLKSE